MDTLINEYLFYVAMMLTGMIAFALFFVFASYFFNKKVSISFWRPVGLFLLASVFFFAVGERRFENLELVTRYVEMLALIFIAVALFFEISVHKYAIQFKRSHTVPKKRLHRFMQKLETHSEFESINRKSLPFAVIIFVLSFGSLIYFYVEDELFGKVFYLTVTIVIMLAIIFRQITRYIKEKNEYGRRLGVNLFLFAATFFLLFRYIFIFFNTVPTNTDIVFFKEQTLDYSTSWYLVLVFTAIAGILILIANWKFLARDSLHRLIITLLLVTVAISSIASFIFGSLIFQIIEDNNYDVVEKAVRSQELILQDRGRTAHTLANSLRDNPTIVSLMSQDKFLEAGEELSKFAETSEIDVFRLYDEFGVIVADYEDPRNENILKDDQFVSFAITERKGIKTFDTEEGVLADRIFTRSLYPILSDDQVVGVIEAGFVFDNAFVDYIKKQTGVDVTIYANDVRSASTIVIDDGVTRWIGSIENNEEIISTVLQRGEPISKQSEFSGSDYYFSILPLKDINGDTVGMISAQIPVFDLIQSIRYDLIETFLIVTNVNLALSYVAYRFLREYLARNEATNEK